MGGHIVKRGSNWAIVLELGVDHLGKRKQKWITFKGTKREAEREMNRLLNEVHTGSYVEPAKMPLKEFLERWLADCAKLKVAPKTFERYAEIVRTHLVPALGQYQLCKLQPLDIQRYYAEALQSGRRDGKGGLAPMTVLHHHRLLRSALQQAVRWGLLQRNPADAVEAPRPEHKEMEALDAEGTAHLLDSAQGGRLYLPVLLAVTTGMRLGEILGVRWQDVDLEAATLSVRQAIQQTRDGITFKQPKTQKSRRVVKLPSVVVEALRQHQRRQEQIRSLLGTSFHDHGLVLPQDDGKPWPPRSLSKSFEHLAERAGVPQIRFHDLRHSHASQLLKLGVHAKVVSERLGHARVATTLDIYSHVLPGLQEEAAKRVDAALRAAMGDPPQPPQPPAG
jgi:integrase